MYTLTYPDTTAQYTERHRHFMTGNRQGAPMAFLSASSDPSCGLSDGFALGSPLLLCLK